MEYKMKTNISRGKKPDLQDFIDALPSGQKVIKTGSHSVVTNCVHPTHEDKKPSMGIKQGDRAVFVVCFSRGCPKDDLLKYFYERIPYYQKRGGKYDR